MSSANALPLSRDASSRFLPWFIAFMVWLATIALAVILLVSSYSDQWRHNYTGTLTVQIPAATDKLEIKTELRLKAALRLLQNTPGIVSAEAIPMKHISDLLVPWLGRDIISETLDLPIPRLIDVKFIPNANLDVGALWEKLEKEVEGAQIDDHRVWLQKLITLTDTIEAIAFIVLLLISVAASAIIVFATRTSLTIHSDLIELLHLMGARDEYVAGQFHRHVMRLGLKGGVLGAVLATVTLISLGSIWSNIDSLVLPPLSLNLWQWVCVLAVPLAAAAVTTLTARITVLRTLGRLT